MKFIEKCDASHSEVARRVLSLPKNFEPHLEGDRTILATILPSTCHKIFISKNLLYEAVTKS
jgi:hypothetical protein